MLRHLRLLANSNRVWIWNGIRKNSSSSSSSAEERTTHFGFQTVREEEKVNQVYSVFERVAGTYDTMNDAMSFGIHRLWKDYFVHKLAPTHGSRLLDCAGGTGDITFRYLNALSRSANPEGRQSHVTVGDINENMLQVGQARYKRLGLDRLPNVTVDWTKCDAEKLQFEDESFDAYTIAFGIRNVTHIDKVLEEAYRVLNPGGRFLCLEFSHVENDLLRWAYDKYSFQIIPTMGTLIAGDWKAYQYLVESIRKFPKQEEFKEMIEDAGFRSVTYENLSFGVVAIHSGFKI